MNEEQPVKKRRIRYKGTHPRRYEEKYKELNPQKYADDIKKVMERGQTPVGMHRPICLNEILTVLNPRPGMIGLDATLGFGGHSQELLKHVLPDGILYALDVDPIELPRTEKRLRDLGYNENVLVIKRMNFAGILKLLNEVHNGFDFILADLGVSSMQIDTPSRGFSFKLDGPLDLRLNPSKGLPASQAIWKLTTEELTDLLVTNADEPHAALIASSIIANKDRIGTTKQLANVITVAFEKASGKMNKDDIKKSLQRTFQALRIYVNDEFGVLDQFLAFVQDCLKPGGRVAILTFHSGEDRRVKKSFLEKYRNGIYSEIAKDPVRPSGEEMHANPRSTCAKLRWAEKKK
jgi:16S rRNA (cytosine1402-N4)-methyltransferase